MKAIYLLNNQEYECYEPDLKILNIAANASWYIPLDFCTFILIECKPDSIYATYKVNDKTYINLGTLPYDKLTMPKSDIQIQPSLFSDEMILTEDDEDENTDYD